MLRAVKYVENSLKSNSAHVPYKKDGKQKIFGNETVKLTPYLSSDHRVDARRTSVLIRIIFTKMESTRKEFSKFGFVWLKDFFSDHQKCLVENWAEEVHTLGSLVLKKSSLVMTH